MVKEERQPEVLENDNAPMVILVCAFSLGKREVRVRLPLGA